jgi:uncharacterized membrane protein YhhN
MPTSGIRALWSTAALVAAGYGLVLVILALHLPAGAELTGRFPGQPALKALPALLLALAATGHRPVIERRWLVAALLFSAAGDALLAMPSWELSFVLGLAAFLIAHLCFLGLLLPLARAGRGRTVAVAVLWVGCVALLIWFWPQLRADGMTLPVTAYIAVLGAMVSAALLADLPTPWTAAGAVCFAVSDAMIGIGRFVLANEALAVPIWWVYALSLLLLTAGLLFGRESEPSARPAG